MAKSRHAAPEAIRITKVGSWYVLFTVLVAIAATNTGNNALYMVWAVMLAVLVVSGVVSRQNLRSLEVELAPPGEVFANQPTGVAFTLRNRGRFWPRWFLLVSLARTSRPWLVPHLPVAGVGKGEFEVSFPRRGLETLKAVHVSTLFPFGLFKKGARYPLELELLVFPELFPASSVEPEATGENGQQSRRERGRGPDLHLLRDFQPGDDPRGIHWKQTARTGQTIFLEREAEDSRRLSILFDNGVGALRDEAEIARFEHLVSEAATAAVYHLSRGWEVELVSRDRRLPFAAGARQRWAVLEALALIAPAAPGPGALLPADSSARVVALGPQAREAA